MKCSLKNMDVRKRTGLKVINNMSLTLLYGIIFTYFCCHVIFFQIRGNSTDETV